MGNWPAWESRSRRRPCGEIRNTNGTGPAPRRTGPPWSQFLRSEAETILACDLFTAGLPDGAQAYVLAVIEHASRRLRILGATWHPTGAWPAQQARHLIMDLGEQAPRAKFMIAATARTSPPHSTRSSPAGIKTVPGHVRTPRRNAIAERWIGDAAANSSTAPSSGTRPTCGGPCRDDEIHHNQHRPHRSLHGAAPLKPLPEPVDLDQHRARKHTRAGGLINEYRLVA